MLEFILPYGKTTQVVSVPSELHPELILPTHTDPTPDTEIAIRNALQHPLGFSWHNDYRKDTVGIVVNDKTRPVPNEKLLPPLIQWLEEHGVRQDQIQFFIATGSHTPMTDDEFRNILPEWVIKNYKITSHNTDDESNLVYLGSTSRQTEVWCNQAFYQCSLKITVGEIEPHHFAGFSGGYKSSAIGMAGRKTINHNHAKLSDPFSFIGNFETNPLRQDIEEIGAAMGVHLCLNVILNDRKEIVSVIFGAPGNVITAGIPIVRAVCETPCAQKFDLVIASAGGYPKDINFYQAQKALTHASLFCKTGGSIILAAECREGSGNKAYEEFMIGIMDHKKAIEKFDREGFRVGPHKAIQMALLLDRFEIHLISSMEAGLVKRLLMEPSVSAQEALEATLHAHKDIFTCAVLPHATTTIAAVTSQ